MIKLEGQAEALTRATLRYQELEARGEFLVRKSDLKACVRMGYDVAEGNLGRPAIKRLSENQRMVELAAHIIAVALTLIDPDDEETVQ